jgi:hypothetical protein
MGEIEQVGALGIVELKSTGNGVEDGSRHPADGAALQLGVVLHADPRESGDLAAAQARDTAHADIGHTRLLRSDLGPPRGQELADLDSVVHAATVRANHHTRDSLSVHVSIETPTPIRNRVG